MIQYQVQSSLFLIGAITSLVTLTTLSRAYWQRPINDLEDNRNHLWNLLSCWYMSRPSIWCISWPTLMKDSILHRYCLVQFFFEFMFSCRCILNHNPYGTCLDQQPSVFWLVSLVALAETFLICSISRLWLALFQIGLISPINGDPLHELLWDLSTSLSFLALHFRLAW